MSIQLSQTVNVASLYIRQAPLSGVGGVANEPALTIANTVRQFILAPPFSWRWNRAATSFIATVGQQDYTLSSWKQGTLVKVGTLIVDSNGNQQRCVVSGTTGGSQPTWATSGTTTDGGVTWQCDGTVPAKDSLASFGWLESATVQDNESSVWGLEVKLELDSESQQNRPTQISAQIDSGDGTVSFRLFPPPDLPYKVVITYQKSAPLFTSLSDVWDPIPDYLYFLCFKGFVSRSMEYLNDVRYFPTEQMFLRMVLAASEGLKDSEKSLFLSGQIDAIREQQNAVGNANNARQARGGFQ